MLIVKYEEEEIENIGCNNGNYPTYKVTFNTKEVHIGRRCRCGHGCSCTDNVPYVGQSFKNMDKFYNYIYSSIM